MELGRTETARCIRGRLPDCAGECPFRFDVRSFTEQLARGRLDAAYRTYEQAVLFPAIVSRLCPAGCQTVCRRAAAGGPIRRKLLERAVADHAVNKEPVRLNLPRKERRIAVIGGGPAGLACALRLARRKYPVTVFERADRIGGSLLDREDTDVFLADIRLQFGREEWEIRLGSEISCLPPDYDAFFIATGSGGRDLGASPGHSPGVFLGGGLVGHGIVEAIRDGRDAADEIESYLKTGKMPRRSPSPPVGSLPDPAAVSPQEAVEPEGSGLYTPGQAQLEAQRCFRCSCGICMARCPLMTYYRRTPAGIAELVEGTLIPTDLSRHRVGMRILASCDQCGLCLEVCPEKIDLRRMLLSARRALMRQGALPRAFSSFWLEDMAHANGSRAALVRPAEGKSTCHYAFFPGCQLPASDPRYVSLTLQRLRQMLPEVGLLSLCCGMPARLAGDEAGEADALALVREGWETLGRPTLLCACPRCQHHLAETLPMIPLRSLYELEWEAHTKGGGQEIGVFDPCMSRFFPDIQRRVRSLLRAAGFSSDAAPPSPLSLSCCGRGGQYETANPSLDRDVVAALSERLGETTVTYCAGCRDSLARTGREVHHILDYLLGINQEGLREPPAWSQRRRNRELLRTGLSGTGHASAPGLRIRIPDNVSRLLQERWLLEEDIAAVIAHCEETGEYLCLPDSLIRIGHLELRSVTYWVHYTRTPDGYELVNAYSHRMCLEGKLP